MKLRSVVRDCLYLNWALPADALPEPPAPLRYELHDGPEGRAVFVSAVLFRQQGLRLAALPMLRLSYPQANLRLYVLDGEGVPSVLFLRTLVPAWVVPGARWLARQPAAAARFTFPPPGDDSHLGRRSWSIEGAGALAVAARPAAPRLGPGPRLGSWEAAVSYFRHRPRGYSRGRRGLRRVAAGPGKAAVCPLAAEVEEAGLLERVVGVSPWPALHSAFLCPEIPFVFELAAAPEMAALKRAPASVAADPAMFTRAA